MKSIKAKMLWYICIPIFIMILILGGVAYLFSNQLLLEESSILMQRTAEKYGSDLETMIAQNESYMLAMATDLELSMPQKNQLTSHLAHIVKSKKEIFNICIAFNDGSFYDGLASVLPKDFDPRTRPWYRAATEQDMVVSSNPYNDALTGNLVLTLSKQMKRQNQPLGVLGIDMSFENIHKTVQGIRIKENGKAFLISRDGIVLSHPVWKLGDHLDQVENNTNKDLSSKLNNEKNAIFEWKRNLFATYSVRGTSWLLVLEVPKSEMLESTNKLGSFMVIIGILTLSMIGFIIYLIASSISKPIVKLSEHVEKMATFDLRLSAESAPSIFKNRTDELGVMSNALISVQTTMQRVMTDINDVASQVSASSQELTATSDQSAQAVEKVSRAVQEISAAASIQANEVQNGMTSMESMSIALRDNEQSIHHLNETNRQVFLAKEQGVLTIQQLIKATNEVKTSSRDIMTVIVNTNDSAIQISNASDMIKSIADQTNLLALNAAIEAARAGDSGRGFSVVAEEIRKLAEQSTQFTEEIKSVVSSLNDKTSQAVMIIQSASELIDEQSKKVEETHIQFDSIATELEKNEKSVSQLNESEEKLKKTREKLLSIMENLSTLSEENASSARESTNSVEQQLFSIQEIANSSAELSNMAQDMNILTSQFKI